MIIASQLARCRYTNELLSYSACVATAESELAACDEPVAEAALLQGFWAIFRCKVLIACTNGTVGYGANVTCTLECFSFVQRFASGSGKSNSRRDVTRSVSSPAFPDPLPARTPSSDKRRYQNRWRLSSVGWYRTGCRRQSPMDHRLLLLIYSTRRVLSSKTSRPR